MERNTTEIDVRVGVTTFFGKKPETICFMIMHHSPTHLKGGKSEASCLNLKNKIMEKPVMIGLSSAINMLLATRWEVKYRDVTGIQQKMVKAKKNLEHQIFPPPNLSKAGKNKSWNVDLLKSTSLVAIKGEIRY